MFHIAWGSEATSHGCDLLNPNSKSSSGQTSACQYPYYIGFDSKGADQFFKDYEYSDLLGSQYTALDPSKKRQKLVNVDDIYFSINNIMSDLNNTTSGTVTDAAPIIQWPNAGLPWSGYSYDSNGIPTHMTFNRNATASNGEAVTYTCQVLDHRNIPVENTKCSFDASNLSQVDITDFDTKNYTPGDKTTGLSKYGDWAVEIIAHSADNKAITAHSIIMPFQQGAGSSPTPSGPETISWPDSAYALQVPNGVSSDGTIHGASLDADAKLENPQPGDVLTYACGIYTVDHSARVSGSTCMVAPSGTERALTITELHSTQAYAIHVSATVTRNGTTVPSATIPWIKLWKDIPAATHSESISWPLNDAIADISIPTGYTDGKLSGALIANAVLLNPPKDGSDAINYECGVYDSSMQHQISGATCKIGESTNRLHTVSVTGLPTTPTPLIIHFSASVLRDGKTTVSPNIIPWIKVNKNTTAS